MMIMTIIYSWGAKGASISTGITAREMGGSRDIYFWLSGGVLFPRETDVGINIVYRPMRATGWLR
jgi:hypothetical protein